MDNSLRNILDDSSNLEPSASIPSSAQTDSEYALLDAYSRAVISTADAVSPAVTYLEVKRPSQNKSRSTAEQHGSGSGFIFAQDGFILTNSHVVHGAKKIDITLNDSRQFAADLIGDDPDTDLAAIRIGASGLPAL